MNQDITPLSDIDPMMDEVKVLVRCISKWFNHPQGKPNIKWSLEMVLQDQLGNRIQASVMKNCMKKFEPIIDEGTCYRITNFGVGENGGNYPLVNHKYRINFYMNTMVTRVNKFDNNVHGFRFEPFQNFSTKHFSSSDFVDVIGTVVSISDLIPFSGGLGQEKRRRTILLQDVHGLQLECCFFDGWADRFNILAEHRDKVGHVVLILQLARVKYFNEKPSITNVVFATKIYNNAELPEIETFKRRYQEVDGYDESRHTITLWSPTRKEITPEVFFSGAVKKMVGSIRDSFEIHKIHREFGWSFLARNQCGRSAKETDDDGSSSGKAATKFKKIEKTYACKYHKGVAVVLETDIQEKEQKESQKQTKPSTEWKRPSQKSST
ncbi:replication protein A 70 kDa DNA-binding subunit B [Tanacetum coccineum]